MPVVELLKSAPAFRRLWLGNLISSSGDWIGWVAVSVLAMKSESGALELAGVFIAHYLPAALLAPLGGFVADRWDRRKILIWVTLGQFVLTLAMAVAALRAEVLWVQLLLALRSTAVAFIAPAERGAVPRLVATSQVLLANAVDSATWSIMFTIGTALGGLISVLGPTTALGIDAGTFVLALFFYARLPAIVPERDEQEGPRDPQNEHTLPSLREILWWLWGQPKILCATLAKAPLSLASGAAWLALNLSAESKVTGVSTSVALGAFYACRGIGTAIGPWIASRLHGPRLSREWIWMITYLSGLASMLGFWAADRWSLWIPCALIWGISGGVNWVFSTAITQRDVPDRYRGRIGALDTLSWMSAQCISVALCAWQVHQGGDLTPYLRAMCILGMLGIVTLKINSARDSRESDADTV